MVFSQTLRRAAAQSAGAYRSPFAPKYYTPMHVQGVNAKTATKYAQIAGTFGVSLGVFAVFFFGEVPRVRNDVLRQFPFFDQYFDRTIAPEDNPF
ncbi:ubiquinol-cytochrome-c reductase complex subunit-domain-containing protein [Aspergillus floccosus]